MKLHIANYQPDRIGGGWTFARNLAKDTHLYSYEESDTYLIAGPTMVDRVDVGRAMDDGKKIVLRVDNAVRNSRNRGTGMTRLLDYARWADLVIYQSQWAKDFLMPFTDKDGPVILNGVDTRIYKPGRMTPDPDSYLYVRSSRDEGKQWIMAWYWFVNNPGRLDIVGKFSPENVEYKFDFYNGEYFRFLGEQTNMVDIYRQSKYFLYPYLNDACSNTLLEARACGMEIVDVYGMLSTGGAPEIMACEDISLERMCKQYEEALSVL